jgi:GTP cyclohydrolase II
VIRRLAERPLLTSFGAWQEFLYYDGQAECIALVYGDVASRESVPCRLHSACLSAHVFNSVECDCREQMILAQGYIQSKGYGVVIWLDQDGRGNGHLALMLAARMAEEESIPQTEAYVRLGYSGDNRDYRQACEILHELDISSVELLSDSPDKAESLTRCGTTVASTKSVSLDLARHPELRKYYLDKAARGYNIESAGAGL